MHAVRDPHSAVTATRRARRLYGLWLGAVLAPAALLLVEGLGRTTLTAGGAWLLGGPVLAAATARDPEGRALDGLRDSGASIRIAVSATLLVAVGMVLFPITLVVCGLLLAILGGVALWAIVGPSRQVARILKGIATTVIVVEVLGIAGEIVLRLPPVVAVTGGHRPGLLRWEQEHYDRLWERNPLGLRSFHLQEPKPPGTHRILALGDEATFGALIGRTEDTWPCLLEEGLVKEGGAVEVVNAGRRGFTTVNEAEWLQQSGSDFDPDLVVVQFGVNDTVPSYPNFRAEGSFWYFDVRPLLPVVHPFLYSRSYLYSALDAFKEHQVMRLVHPEGFLPLYDDRFEGWIAAQRALHSIAAWANARGARVLLVLFPDFEPDTVLSPDGYRYAPIDEKVRRVARAEGMDVLDLFPEIAARGRPPRAWWSIRCEPTAGPEVQRVAAALIRAEIDREHLLRPAASATTGGKRPPS